MLLLLDLHLIVVVVDGRTITTAVGVSIRTITTTSTRTTTARALDDGSHVSVKRRQIAHHLLIKLLLIRMNRLSMLSKVIEPRELLPTMTGEWTFAGMFPDVPSQMLTPRKHHSTLSITPTLKRLCRNRPIPLRDGIRPCPLRPRCRR